MAQTEVKVKASTAGTAVASAVLALLNATAGNSALLGGLPAWLQFVIITILPSVIAYVSGFLMPSDTSRVSTGFYNKPPVA